MSDSLLYTYKAPKLRNLTDDDRAAGIPEESVPHHPGVPLRDLTTADLEALPGWLQDTIAASDLYAATPAGTRWHNATVRARSPEPIIESTKPAAKAEKATESGNG